MNEYILVEFLLHADDYDSSMEMLTRLGSDFQLLDNQFEYETENDIPVDMYLRVSGKINSMTASILKLQNPNLAEKMRVSYIPEDLKNKYRK